MNVELKMGIGGTRGTKSSQWLDEVLCMNERDEVPRSWH